MLKENIVLSKTLLKLKPKFKHKNRIRIVLDAQPCTYCINKRFFSELFDFFIKPRGFTADRKFGTNYLPVLSGKQET